jgi:hypothetical protein
VTIRKRSAVIGSLFVLALGLYFAAKQYSSFLILYVVEQSLIQKAPEGTDPARLRARFHSHIAAVPDQDARLERLLRISQYLEKVQHLTAAQLDGLLAGPPGTSRAFPASVVKQATSRSSPDRVRSWNFLTWKMSHREDMC